MTTDRDRLHALADETGRGYIQLSGDMLAGLLDALTRAEAQSAIRGRAVTIYQRRAREAEAEARTQRHRADDMEDNALRTQTNLRAAEERVDEWRQAALEESAAHADEEAFD